MIEAVAEHIDLSAIKKQQQAVWSSGNYSAIGTLLQPVGEQLSEKIGIRAGERVLDVATGNGNAALAAARRNAEVIGIDYVPELLERGRLRANADGLSIDFRESDLEQLPFADASFDVVLSTFGVMFSPGQEQAAEELMRVCRPGGRIGMANWTPEGFIGNMLRLVGSYAPPPAGVRPPTQWGSEARLRELFASAADITIERRNFTWNFRSAEDFLHTFRTTYGPMLKAFGRVDAEKQVALAADLIALAERFKRDDDVALIVPAEYLEVIVTT
jgi:SAM-dependent methyltransferase